MNKLYFKALHKPINMIKLKDFSTYLGNKEVKCYKNILQ